MQLTKEFTKCVLCGTKQEIDRVSLEDSDLELTYLDGRPANVEVDMLIKLVQRCSRCGYCASDIAAPMPGAGDAMESESYQLGMSEAPNNPGWIPFCKGVIEEKNEHYSSAGSDLLLSVWYFDDKGLKQEANQQRQRALKLLVAGRQRGQDYGKIPGLQSLAMVDIFRRTGQFTMADAAITTAAREADKLPNREWIREILTLQTAWLAMRDIEGHLQSEVPSRNKDKISSGEKFKARNLPTPMPAPKPPMVKPETLKPSLDKVLPKVEAKPPAAATEPVGNPLIPAPLPPALPVVAALPLVATPSARVLAVTKGEEEKSDEVDLSETVRIQLPKEENKFEHKGRRDATPVKQIRSVDGHPKAPSPIAIKEAGKPGWSLQLPDGFKSKFVVIDASKGGPAEGVEIAIFHAGLEVARCVSNSKGTMDELVKDLTKGEYELNIPINKGMVKELRIKFDYDPNFELMLLIANSGANLVAR